jgi:hypothetical protein
MNKFVYIFGKTKYTLTDTPAAGATLTIHWNSYWLTYRKWTTFVFDVNGDSTVTTSKVAYLFDAYTISMLQDHFKRIITLSPGVSPFKKLKTHLDARQLQEGIPAA